MAGTECNRAEGSAGTVAIGVGADGVVTIRCESSDGGGGGGEETPLEPLVVTPSSLAFGNVPVFTVATRQVTVTNPNDTPVALDLVTSPAVFSATPACGTTVAAHGSCTIDVSFRPVADVVTSGELTITPAGLPVVVVNLSGTGVPDPGPG